MSKPEITYKGKKHALTIDNATLVLFRGNDDLDHVEVRLDDEVVYSFDAALVKRLCHLDYPIYFRCDRPQWAVDRFMQLQVDDLDKLLYGVD